jgi:hypothetical protein
VTCGYKSPYPKIVHDCFKSQHNLHRKVPMIIAQNHTTSQVNKVKIDTKDFSFSDWSFSVKVTKILALLFNASKNLPSVFYSHQRMAFVSGMSVSTVRRSLQELKENGFISWRKKWGYNQTNRYQISPEYLGTVAGHNLQSIFRIMFAISLTFVLSKERSIENERLLNIRSCYYKCKVGKRLYTDPAKSSDPPVITLTFSKKEREKSKISMIDVKDRREIIEKISEKYPLTLRGKIKLSIYHRHVLRYLLQKVEYVLTKDSPFRMLLWLAEEYCKAHVLPINRDIYSLECQSIGLPISPKQIYQEDMFAYPREAPTKVSPHSPSKARVPDWVIHKRLTTSQIREEREKVVTVFSAISNLNPFQKILQKNFSDTAD